MSSIRPRCTIEKCDRYLVAKGLCGKHYQRLKNGIPMDYIGREYHESTHTVEYHTWCSIKARCYNKSYKHYEYYGGRGIEVCERWLHSFTNFLEDMGKRPVGDYSIERQNTNGNYEPDNCIWTTKEAQANNMRNNLNLTLGNATYTLSQWSKISGISASDIKSRLKLGWSISDAVFKPVRRFS